jgi:hypothetical protein
VVEQAGNRTFIKYFLDGSSQQWRDRKDCQIWELILCWDRKRVSNYNLANSGILQAL